jgi:hypothetical protein
MAFQEETPKLDLGELAAMTQELAATSREMRARARSAAELSRRVLAQVRADRLRSRDRWTRQDGSSDGEPSAVVDHHLGRRPAS